MNTLLLVENLILLVTGPKRYDTTYKVISGSFTSPDTKLFVKSNKILNKGLE